MTHDDMHDGRPTHRPERPRAHHGPRPVQASGVDHGGHDEHSQPRPRPVPGPLLGDARADASRSSIFSHMFQELLGYSAPHFPGSTWISPVLGTVIFVYGGWPFLTGAVARGPRPAARDDAA